MLTLSRWLTAAWGLVLIAIAILARGWGSVFTVGLTIASIVYGPMLGAFLLGVLTTSATETGAMAGIGVSLAAMLAVYLWTPLAWTWYVLAGTIVCVTIGMSVSWAAPRKGLRPLFRAAVARTAKGCDDGRGASGCRAGDRRRDRRGRISRRRRRGRIERGTDLDRVVRPPGVRPRLAGGSRRYTVRSRVDHEGDRHDDDRHGSGGTRRSVARPAGGRRVPRMARHGSRVGDRRRSARARVGAAGASGRCAARRPTRVRARHLHDAARIRASDDVDLQRSRIHPARISSGGLRRRLAGGSIRCGIAPAQARGSAGPRGAPFPCRSR